MLLVTKGILAFLPCTCYASSPHYSPAACTACLAPLPPRSMLAVGGWWIVRCLTFLSDELGQQLADKRQRAEEARAAQVAEQQAQQAAQEAQQAAQEAQGDADWAEDVAEWEQQAAVGQPAPTVDDFTRAFWRDFNQDLKVTVEQQAQQEEQQGEGEADADEVLKLLPSP